MGWLFTKGQTRKELIAHLTQDWVDTETGRRHVCMAHTARGNVLWSVWCHDRQDRPVTVIHCDLMRSDRSYGWGYKDMSENMGPRYYTCPPAYLEMAQDDINTEWRALVYEYHGRVHQKLVLGMKVTLIGSTTEWVRITSTMPLRGVGTDGVLYRIPRGMLGKVMED